MSPEQEEKFYAAFPELFRGRGKPITESLMCYGIDCPDAWFDMLWQHCVQLEALAQAEGKKRDSAMWPEIFQIKEKLGSLRCYVRPESDAMRELYEKLVQDSNARFLKNAALEYCFNYLDQVGCFTWTLMVKVKTCFCAFHPHPHKDGDNTIAHGVYEVQADVIAYMPMGHHRPMSLHFSTKDFDKSRQAQDILQAEQVVVVRCNCWNLDEPITLYISDLEELSQQISRLPPEHEQAVSALINSTNNF